MLGDLESFLILGPLSHELSIREHTHVFFFFIPQIQLSIIWQKAQPNLYQTKFQYLMRKYISDVLAKNAKPPV